MRPARLTPFVSALLAMVLAPGVVHAQHSLAAARDLYAAAAYDEALGVLEMLPANASVMERESAGLYRALCFLALGRTSDATRALETIVQTNPLYRPSEEDVPPRVRSALTDARRRLLPAMIHEKYTDGKAAYDRKEYTAAADLFARMLEELADPDLTAAAAQPPLADLRTLASGFLALSEKAAAPPPPPAAVPMAAPPARRVYTGTEPGVGPPEVLQQVIPSYGGRVTARKVGVVELLIDEQGTVESASMRVPIEPRYDERVLAAAKGWIYRPATFEGMPVRFLRRVQVVVEPSPAR